MLLQQPQTWIVTEDIVRLQRHLPAIQEFLLLPGKWFGTFAQQGRRLEQHAQPSFRTSRPRNLLHCLCISLKQIHTQHANKMSMQGISPSEAD